MLSVTEGDEDCVGGYCVTRYLYLPLWFLHYLTNADFFPHYSYFSAVFLKKETQLRLMLTTPFVLPNSSYDRQNL